jgi:hypothetical protein
MVDVYRIFHPETRQHTLFSAPYGTFSTIEHIIGHKTSFNKFKKIEITPYIISDYKGIKLNVNNKRNPRKYLNIAEKQMGVQSNKGRYKKVPRIQ